MERLTLPPEEEPSEEPTIISERPPCPPAALGLGLCSNDIYAPDQLAELQRGLEAAARMHSSIPEFDTETID